MLTILSHLVFWPAILFNIVFWIFVLGVLFDQSPTRITVNDAIFAIMALAMMFVPGVYLFGIW